MQNKASYNTSLTLTSDDMSNRNALKDYTLIYIFRKGMETLLNERQQKK